MVLDGSDSIAPDEFYGLFMKFSMSPGIHHISLTYHIPGFKAGAAVSLLCLAIYTSACLFYKRSLRKC